MTRDKAIDLIDNLIGMVEDNSHSDYDTALKMAIKALEQEPKTQERQAESDKFDAAFQDGYNNGYAQARFDYEQEPILDKIRTEIETKYGQCDIFEWHTDCDFNYYQVGDIADILQIIDKYKAEIESQER